VDGNRNSCKDKDKDKDGRRVVVQGLPLGAYGTHTHSSHHPTLTPRRSQVCAGGIRTSQPSTSQLPLPLPRPQAQAQEQPTVLVQAQVQAQVQPQVQAQVQVQV
jgi:hypothetical protein